MENSKRGSIPMQDKLILSKSQGASTPAELKRMQSVPYASDVGSIMNTKDMFLVYGGDLKRELRVSCYTDAGYLTDADDLKSQTGYVFVLNGGAVDWKSAKQSIFATSSAEAEYIAAFDASKEAVWVRKFISGLGVVPTIEKPINMYCDNTGAIAIANESGITKGARHFRAKVHYLREVIEFGDIKLEKVHTDDNLADPFTKALAFPKHSELTRNMGMLPTSSLIESWNFDEFPLRLSPWTTNFSPETKKQSHALAWIKLPRLGQEFWEEELWEVDIIKKPENQAKMTKLSMEWKRLCKIKAKVQKCQSQSQYRRISSQTGAGTEEYYWMQS
ncbi:retrotransposon protein, putative, ty1-copia subclass [Tanacetum coccineum]